MMALVAMLVAAAPSLGIEPIAVPAKIRAITSMPELSGLAWNDELGRFLTVSDDTGLERQGTTHLPIIFTLSPDGVLDESPLRITGLDALNDAESICAGPDGTYFLVTSHSPTSSGRLPRARRQLLHLALQDHSLTIIGKVDLLQVPVLAQRLGQPDMTAIDVEAIAFDAGGLYLGFKAPLDAHGQARILRLSDPLVQLRRGVVDANLLTVWRSPRLCLPSGVCQGVSDLVVHGATALVVANSPKGAPSDQGGALWRLDEHGTATLLRQFVGRKPEGLTVHDHQAVIVFDRDRLAPEWVKVPLDEQAP